LPDGSLLVSGVTNQYPIYTVRALATTTAITGFRLEALADASLPAQGPGRQPANGNFVMSEFSVDAIAVPEPSTGLALLGMAAAVTLRRRRNR
jgi:hypothetical protein